MSEELKKSTTYTEFWQKNLATIDDISTELKKSLNRLKNESAVRESIEEEIHEKIDDLARIYSSYNTLAGKNYVLKLKAIFERHQKLREKEKSRHNTIDYIISQIDSLRSRSFDSFPELEHRHHEVIRTRRRSESFSEDAEYKWISFIRNGSWFLKRYRSAKIVLNPLEESSVIPKAISVDDTRYNVTDLFAKDTTVAPRLYIIIDKRCYAADGMGLRFLSHHNFFFDKCKSFTQKSSIASGYARIRGRRYIILK